MSADLYEISNDRELLRSRELILEDIAEYRDNLARIDAEMRKRGLEIEPHGRPSDAEVEAAAVAIHAVANGGDAWEDGRMVDKKQHRSEARAALLAAGGAR